MQSYQFEIMTGLIVEEYLQHAKNPEDIRDAFSAASVSPCNLQHPCVITVLTLHPEIIYILCVSPDGPISEEDEELSRIAMAYMANFARTGCNL